MDLPNIKELEKLLKMCRKQGVTELTLAEVIIKFGELPRDQADTEEELAKAQPSDEELLYWSSAPDPLAERLNGETQ